MKKTFIPLFVGLLCWTGVQATVHYVRVTDGADDAARGTALKNTISNAFSGDTVKVQAGTFTGNFIMKNGVNVSGGWNESFTSQTKYGTILDGNASGRVLKQEEDFDQMTVWDNLTIQNGKLMSNGKGAGVYLLWKSKLTNCLIQNNTFDTENVTECEGGGLAQDKDHHADDVIADNCVIRNNKATHGGGIWIRSTITNSVIEDNKTLKSHPGGGAHLQWGRMYNCIIRRNHSSEDAGGVRACGNCKLINCLIADNTCDVKTAGLALERTLDEVINCTVVNNNQTLSSTDQEYCGIRFDANDADGNKFVNNVVWGNKAGGVVQSQQVSYSICKYSNANATNNAIQDNVPGDFKTSYLKLTSDNTTDSGNDKAPKFTNPSGGDYTLQASSPLKDEGDNTHNQSTLDCYGGPRQNGDNIDIGAFECQWIDIDGDRTVPVGQNLQYIINNTDPGRTVKVQAGTFYGNFTMKENVQLSGGWNESFTSQTDYTTILDAKGSGRVLNQPSNFSTMTIWSNFTIQNGNLTSPGSENIGSGVALKEKGQVKHCLIQNNTFSYSGENCLGGGVGSETTLSSRDLVMVDDCIIRNNTATHGGGVRIRGTIQNSLIEENRTTNNAAGGVQLNLDGNMYNCIVRNNHSGGDIGGVRLNGTESDGIIANCLIYGNTAAGSVGGVGVELHNIINCTIVGNKQGKTDTDKEYCGVHSSASADRDRKFVNNIVWGNKAGDEVQPQQINSSLVHWTTRTNNAIQGIVPSGWGEYIVLDLAPGFADAAENDYRLTYPSVLLNSGNDTYAVGEKDLGGNDRLVGTIDIGCYEYEKNIVTDAREIPQGYYGTVCLPYGVDASDITDATIYSVVSFADNNRRGIILEEKDAIEAGKPYIYLANAPEVRFVYQDDGSPAVAGNENGLYGTHADLPVQNANYYVLQSNEFRPVSGAQVTVPAYRAYLDIAAVPDAMGNSTLSPRRKVIRIADVQNGATAIDILMQTQDAGDCKILRNGQLYILHDDKTYNAQGLLVK